MHRAFRYRLYPTAEQEQTLRHFAGVTRLIYNLALEQRRDFYRQYQRATGKHLNYVTQGREVTALRAAYDWISAVHSDCQTQALRDLDKAYANFFAGRAGYPTPRKKGLNDSFRFRGGKDFPEPRRVNAKWSSVRAPKIGWIKFRATRPVAGMIKNATFSLDGNAWFVSFVCEIANQPVEMIKASVGIDRGVTNTVALSDGQMLSIPRSLDAVGIRLQRAQRILSRRKKGSARRLRQLRKVARLSAKRARIRKDWHHKTTTKIARRFGVVAIEDLNIRNMTTSASGTIESPGVNVRQKAGLNRSILNQGWYAFETMLAYKLEERGGHLVKVCPAYTSQTCSDCGTIDKKSRESQARFSCQHCGFEAHADTNAAINILRRNTAWLRVEGTTTPDEARTGMDREVHENHLALAG